MAGVSERVLKIARKNQQEEMTGAAVYQHIAKKVGKKNPDNAKIIQQMAEEELEHAAFWKQYTGEDIGVKKSSLLWRKIVFAILGYTFVLKRMEKEEALAAEAYRTLSEEIPEAIKYAEDEEKHEAALIAMLDEERLQYVGAMVLGLNDALVELTGTIAGLTFAWQNTRIVALSGIITGIAATLSMAASNYLAEKADGKQNPIKSSLYTGVAYLITVVILVLPYLLLGNAQYILAFVIMLISVVLIIFFFNYYISVAKGYNFKQRFFQMAGISLGVAALSFGIGLVAKALLGVDVDV